MMANRNRNYVGPEGGRLKLTSDHRPADRRESGELEPGVRVSEAEHRGNGLEELRRHPSRRENATWTATTDNNVSFVPVLYLVAMTS